MGLQIDARPGLDVQLGDEIRLGPVAHDHGAARAAYRAGVPIAGAGRLALAPLGPLAHPHAAKPVLDLAVAEQREDPVAHVLGERIRKRLFAGAVAVEIERNRRWPAPRVEQRHIAIEIACRVARDHPLHLIHQM